MEKVFKILLLVVMMTSCIEPSNKPKIIFDTDFGGDADDLAALAMLHNLHEKRECNLLAVMCWATEQHAVPAIDAINRYYKHPEIPVGVRKQDTYYRDENAYGKSIADRFTYKLTPETAEDATTLYRKILSTASDNSITIVTVGPLYNIKALLESGEDMYSSLPGKELVHQKVKEFVIMGGQFPEGDNEWNFNGNMPGVTKFVIENIELPVTFTGYEIGVRIKTGAILNERDKNTPLYAGFKYFSEHASWMKEYYEGKVLDNSSYDQTAIIYAVRDGSGSLWEKSENGYCIPDSTGGNTWMPSESGNHNYLKLIADPEEIAAIIEAIMLNEE
ncbi:MAG: nucleoside hydrolase [Bacteroidales bacterium]|nr:nucleoside hydrolase [Bacteroidales bacterium]